MSLSSTLLPCGLDELRSFAELRLPDAGVSSTGGSGRVCRRASLAVWLLLVRVSPGRTWRDDGIHWETVDLSDTLDGARDYDVSKPWRLSSSFPTFAIIGVLDLHPLNAVAQGFPDTGGDSSARASRVLYAAALMVVSEFGIEVPREGVACYQPGCA